MKDGIFGILTAESRAASVVILFLSLLVGGLHAGAIYLVAFGAREIQHSRATDLFDFLLLGVVVALFATTKHLALVHAIRLTETSATHLMDRLANLILNTELRDLETVGKERIYSVLTRDLKVIGNTTMIAVHALQSGAVMVGCLVFLAWTSPAGFLLIVAIGGLAGIVFFHTDQLMKASADAANRQEDHFFNLANQMLQGFKELKISHQKNHDLLNNHLIPSAQHAQGFRVEVGAYHSRKVSLFNWFYFPILASVAFIFPELHIQGFAITAITLIFLWTPAVDMLSAVPLMISANLSIQKLYQLETDLRQNAVFLTETQFSPSFFKSLQLQGITFEYTDHRGQTTFRLGPVDLAIEPGEIIFIVGGNGSGKSTLLKVLTGLYPPLSGRILIDGEPRLMDDQRAIFSAVFSDFHLFNRLYGIENPASQQLGGWLQRFHLHHKIQVTDGQFTHLDLSSGQKKRLALILAHLENRPIYVFDEWTADQDPEFRCFFYQELIPEFKAQGKTIISVTHDDRYFQYADRLVRLEHGQIV